MSVVINIVKRYNVSVDKGACFPVYSINYTEALSHIPLSVDAKEYLARLRKGGKYTNVNSS